MNENVSAPDVSAPFQAIRDDRGHFLGFEPRDCGEHRTVGAHRAWCHDCREWCYPHDPCVRCAAARDRSSRAAIDTLLAEAMREAWSAGVDAAICEMRRWAGDPDDWGTFIEQFYNQLVDLFGRDELLDPDLIALYRRRAAGEVAEVDR